jgi:hypothetical protein
MGPTQLRVLGASVTVLALVRSPDSLTCAQQARQEIEPAEILISTSVSACSGSASGER